MKPAQPAVGAVLVVEDRDGLRRVLVDALEGEGFPVLEAAGVEQGLAVLAESRPALVLSDLKLGDGSGLQVVEAARLAGIPTIVLTAYGSVESAVEAMKRGAVDFLEKPVALDALFALVERHRADPGSGRRPFQAPGGPEMVGSAPAFRSALKLLERAAPTATTVLLLGESGTGKELFARSLHLLSPRRDGPFVAVNCAAIPAQLVESELFGHERGAFTGAHQRQIGRFEAAEKGTLLLDEVGELPLPIQAKVLRAIEERVVERVGGARPVEVDVRLVAATNRDLSAMVASSEFRADLYYRLEIFPIRLPPLAERREDVPALARHLLARARERHALPCEAFTSDALAALAASEWPGNVRELANVVERAAILAEGRLIDAALVRRVARRGAADPAAVDPADDTAAERERIAGALREADGRVAGAAELLGLSERTVLRRIKQLGLEGYPRWRES